MPMDTARVLYKEKPGHGTRMLSPGLQRTLIARSMAWLQPLVKITSWRGGRVQFTQEHRHQNHQSMQTLQFLLADLTDLKKIEIQDDVTLCGY